MTEENEKEIRATLFLFGRLASMLEMGFLTMPLFVLFAIAWFTDGIMVLVPLLIALVHLTVFHFVAWSWFDRTGRERMLHWVVDYIVWRGKASPEEAEAARRYITEATNYED